MFFVFIPTVYVYITRLEKDGKSKERELRRGEKGGGGIREGRAERIKGRLSKRSHYRQRFHAGWTANASSSILIPNKGREEYQ